MRRKMSCIYLTEKEQEVLKELADESGLTMSAFMRSLIKRLDNERKAIKPARKQRTVEYAQ